MNRKLCVILLFLSAGCMRQTPPQPVSASPAFRVMGESAAIEETPSDETIGFEIRRRLEMENPAESAGIIIEVSDQIVTLRGSTPSQAAAWRAEASAHAVKGVKQVRNQIVVPAAPALR